MSYRRFQIESRLGGSKRSGCIPLNKDHVRFDFPQGFPEISKYGRGKVREVLILLHEGQVKVGLNIKDIQNLLEKLVMLSGDPDQGFQKV